MLPPPRKQLYLGFVAVIVFMPILLQATTPLYTNNTIIKFFCGVVTGLIGILLVLFQIDELSANPKA